MAARKPHAEVKARRSSRPPRTEADASRPLAYEVKVNGSALSGFRPLSSKRSASTRACHEVVAGNTQPCAGCPALLLAKSSSSRRETAVLGNASGPFRVASAEALGQGRFLLHVLSLGESTVAALQRARVDRTARKAKLSDRELGVLELLLLGRSSADIGGALGITERTVRFHVANVLGKLQADSRADLLRLLL